MPRLGNSKVTVGTLSPAFPLGAARTLNRIHAWAGAAAIWFGDHWVNFYPPAIWKREYTPAAWPLPSPDAIHDHVSLMAFAGSSGVLSQMNNLTSGQVYENVIKKERKGDYLGKTVQVIPHVTDVIKNRIHQVAEEMGGSRIPIQVGAELYGHGGYESDCEILSLMLETLAAARVRDVHLDLGHVVNAVGATDRVDADAIVLGDAIEVLARAHHVGGASLGRRRAAHREQERDEPHPAGAAVRC